MFMTDGCNSWRGHRWARWSKAEEFLVSEDEVSYKQRRHCERCGMEQAYVVVKLTAPTTKQGDEA